MDGFSEESFEFQSTLPVGGATPDMIDTSTEFIISIHAPRGGSDVETLETRTDDTEISIHAPRGGERPYLKGH